MNNLMDLPISHKDILITIHLTSGNGFEQPISIDNADDVQDFMDWYRDPKAHCFHAWSFHTPNEQKITMFRYEHICSLEISGYIEPNGRKTKWYEKVIDKIKVCTGRW